MTTLPHCAPPTPSRDPAGRPLGAVRCAARLGERLGLDVEGDDIRELEQLGALAHVDEFRKRGRVYPLYDLAAIDALDADQVTPVVTARTRWHAASMTTEAAAGEIGCGHSEFAAAVRARGIEPGRCGRWARADVEGLAADEDFLEQLRADRLVTADVAATQILDCARRHFDIAAEHGWLRPVRYHDKEVGRYRTVAVPLYRTGDVEALLTRPGIDWEQVRACPKGRPSPLLAIAGGRKVSRAQLIRAFLQGFGADHGIEMWGWFVAGPDVWEIDWERLDNGPTKTDVAGAIDANPMLRRHRRAIRLHSAAGAAIRFARAQLEPGATVILDTETTDLYGAICEIAVIDASTGATLLDTLVNPHTPIQPTAAAIHGLTDAEVTAPGVPDWPAVYRRLLRVTRGRRILAYNADYDHTVISQDCARCGITRTRLTDWSRWDDVMMPRSYHARARRWLPNGGGHRALADVQTTREHLLRMTAP
ncbi:3'-5' exonuclease [Nocardia wallacei]|uniref:3'-5' exonuclease n=1 Tax=Nocardia wallacei TaxID=480035 RepID=UPI0024577DC3|nr:3'-5' exonuclease [Nocardia wallacei]